MAPRNQTQVDRQCLGQVYTVISISAVLMDGMCAE